MKTTPNGAETAETAQAAETAETAAPPSAAPETPAESAPSRTDEPAPPPRAEAPVAAPPPSRPRRDEPRLSAATPVVEGPDPLPPPPGGAPTWPLKLGIAASVLWLGLVAFSLAESGMPTLSGSSSLIPWELAAFAAGVALPVALIWLVVAYLDRGKRFEREVDELRHLMRQMAYPSGAYEARVKAISDSLRAQAAELNDASHRAVQQRTRCAPRGCAIPRIWPPPAPVSRPTRRTPWRSSVATSPSCAPPPTAPPNAPAPPPPNWRRKAAP